jgi:transcriptional regulator with XRE-family HTH domain
MRDIDYGVLVRLIRTHRGLTQEDLARELDVTVGTLNGWENGRHRPLRAQRKRLERMAEEHRIEPPVMSSTEAADLAASSPAGTKGKSNV